VEQAPEFVGLERAEAERAAMEAGIADVRVLEVDSEGRTKTVATADLRPHRLNLGIFDSKVVWARYF